MGDLDSLSTRIQTTVVVERSGDLERRYVEAVLARYLWLPDTPTHTSRNDRRLAHMLYERGVPLIEVEAALLLGGARRALRGPHAAQLPRIRALHYFLPVVAEVENDGDPDTGYMTYLLGKLRPLAELKLARLRHRAMYGDTG